MSTTTLSTPAEEPHDKKDRSASPGAELFEPQWSQTHELPDPELFALNFTQRALEVLYGTRDLAQIARWVTEDVYIAMQRRVDARVRKLSLLPPPARRTMAQKFTLSHVKIGNPRDGVVEACVVVRTTHRIRAAALRMEGIDRRWRATSFALL